MAKLEKKHKNPFVKPLDYVKKLGGRSRENYSPPSKSAKLI
jgi:hypothetical protein